MTVMLYEEGYCLRNAEEMQTPETPAPSGRLREEIPPERGKIVRVVNSSSEFCMGETWRADISRLVPPRQSLSVHSRHEDGVPYTIRPGMMCYGVYNITYQSAIQQSYRCL